MEPVTLKTLAKELGLSIATVSRALNDSHEIGEETRQRVKTMAQQLGYQPNAYASSLRAGVSKTIAVIIPEVENNFFSQAISGIESVAQEKGYHVLIYLTHEDPEKEKEVMQLLRNGRADGWLISVAGGGEGYDHIKAAAESGQDLVFFDRICGDFEVPAVYTNNEQVSAEAIHYLLERGCKKIAFIGPGPELYITATRRSGYLKALAETGGHSGPHILYCGSDHRENVEKVSSFILDVQPDGIFAASESLALVAYEVCENMGLNIPAQVKVISFSNMRAAAFLNPSLTSIVQPAFDMGRHSAELLFRMIAKKKILEKEKRVELPSRLVIKKSTG